MKIMFEKKDFNCNEEAINFVKNIVAKDECTSDDCEKCPIGFLEEYTGSCQPNFDIYLKVVEYGEYIYLCKEGENAKI